jgi:hypothetical protein
MRRTSEIQDMIRIPRFIIVLSFEDTLQVPLYEMRTTTPSALALKV